MKTILIFLSLVIVSKVIDPQARKEGYISQLYYVEVKTSEREPTEPESSLLYSIVNYIKEK